MSTTRRKERYHDFTPTDTQQQFLNDTAKQVLLYGGFGGGKTLTLNEKIFALNLKYPGNRALICRSHFSDVKGSTIQQSLLEEVIPDSYIPEGGHNKSEHVIKHYTGEYGPNGEPILSEIHYHGLGSSGSGSNDGLPRKISGMEFGTIGIDEATETTEAQYTQLVGRLRYSGRTVGDRRYKIPFRQIIASTNPAGPNHYLYRKFFEDEVGTRYHLRPQDNPGTPDGYVEQLRENYSGVYYERYVEGRWVGTEDIVYDEFDNRTHVVDLDALVERWSDGWERSPHYPDMIRPPDEWEVYRAIDFGYPSPMCVQWWARPPEGGWSDSSERIGPLVMFREFYKSETLVEDVADKIAEWSKDLSVRQTFADPAQANDRETLRRHGVSSTEAEKDVWNGIQRVKSELGHTYGPDAVPGVCFRRDALVNPPDSELAGANKPTRTTEEIPGYEWRDGEGDTPRKRHDHGVDTMRYLIYSLAQRGPAPSREQMEEWEEMFNDGF